MTERIAFGGGCFWCTEAVFLEIKGVTKVTSGYAGGTTPNPTYDSVSNGNTGHAEVVLVEYDPTITPFEKLLEVFFAAHDPTTLNRQGNDYGTQYRSIILFENSEQEKASREMIAHLDESKKFSSPIVTEIAPLTQFFPAEAYHQNYYQEHSNEGYPEAIIKPKVEKIKKLFKDSLK